MKSPSLKRPHDLEVWRLHPQACRLVRADPTLGGAAPMSARRHCGPYIHANGAGFHLYSPVDVDITLERDGRWSVQPQAEFWSDAEVLVVQRMCDGKIPPEASRFLPRTKLFLAGEDSEPSHTAQLWTGCIFRLPPGWALWLRSPVNAVAQPCFRIEEAVLEASWLQQDIWLNLRFIRTGETARIRRDGPPLAQLIPVPHATYGAWQVRDCDFVPQDPGSDEVFTWWMDFNKEKFGASAGQGKNSGLYHRRRRTERR